MGSETQPADGATGLESLPQLLSEWTSSCRDAWLRRELSGLLRQPTTWKQLVAAGMLTSSQALHGDDAHRFARQALAGHVPHDLASVRTWSRQLSATDVARLEQIAVHEAASLRREIYENDPDPESESDLIALWAPFAHRRADIEGVRALLLGANHAPDLLDRILEDIDVAGSALRFALPVEMPIVNERLQRVSSARPDAWWGASFHALLGF